MVKLLRRRVVNVNGFSNLMLIQDNNGLMI